MEEQKKENMERLPAVPLITCDPYFSIWSQSDCLYETDTVHWCGRTKKIRGSVRIDGEEYRFLGLGPQKSMRQTKLEITATCTSYQFLAAGISLEVRFWTPLLLDDLDLMSRPCSYLDAEVRSTDRNSHEVQLLWEFSSELCYDSSQPQKMGGGSYVNRGQRIVWMGQRSQRPLGHSGDGVTIDWGYLYLAAEEKEGTALTYRREDAALCAEFSLTAVPEMTDHGTENQASLIAAYDDIASIFYFGRMLPGYWARNGKGILEAISEAADGREEIKVRCAAFDRKLDAETGAFGESYRTVCRAAYRQAIAAHKLIADEKGQAVFISKECYSNGCAATVDVSYPSTPLFFRYNPELVRGMMRPVLRFADMPVWKYDFAPHDVGRYPYVSGQVYGLEPRPTEARDMSDEEQGNVYPMYYQMPSGAQVYCLKNQMPVEECGNMLIMAAQLARLEPEKEKEELGRYMHLYEKWVQYLLEYGSDPGEQLCTDDFAGHLAHNVNLAVKAIMGVESYSILLKTANRGEEALRCHEKAASMAKDVYNRALAKGHTRLTFGGREESWSLKYNAVWDLIFGSGLWPEAFYRQETDHYRKQQNAYGIPLDNRAGYTKSDWMMWCAAMGETSETVEEYAGMLLKYLRESSSRVPFSDWYDTAAGKQVGFQNRTVQGGIFMPLLRGMK